MVQEPIKMCYLQKNMVKCYWYGLSNKKYSSPEDLASEDLKNILATFFQGGEMWGFAACEKNVQASPRRAVSTVTCRRFGSAQRGRKIISSAIITLTSF